MPTSNEILKLVF